VPTLLPEGEAKLIDAARTFGRLRVSQDEAAHLGAGIKTAEARTAPGGHLADLFSGINSLNPRNATVAPPSKGEAQVLRVASYRGDQLVGGYTIIVVGSE